LSAESKISQWFRSRSDQPGSKIPAGQNGHLNHRRTNMKTKGLTTILAASSFALAVGLMAASGAFASGKEGPERAACAATANPDGSKPANLSEAELRSKLEAAGYPQVRSVGHEDGCIEAKGIDKNGKRFEVYLHPSTGEIVSQR
jgi:hypothetical protein